jgi:hypothetical protein
LHISTISEPNPIDATESIKVFLTTAKSLPPDTFLAHVFNGFLPDLQNLELGEGLEVTRAIAGGTGRYPRPYVY